MNPSPSLAELTRRNIETIAKMEAAALGNRRLSERVADRVAMVIGSWKFIFLQTGLLTVWMILNLFAIIREWDPYPFILLNLLLSCQSAYASPIIMMSQNRQARVNDRRNHLDLQINLLAEQENTQMLRMLRKLCENAGIPIEEDLPALEEATELEKVIRQLEHLGDQSSSGNISASKR
jgi:uncharacterized membrane protein